MKKTLSLLIVLALMCSLLCGCALGTKEIKLNTDGSGVFKSFTGYTKEAWKEDISNKEEVLKMDIDDFLSSVETYNYNGVTYYGHTETKEFSTVDELSEILPDDIKIVDNGDGCFRAIFQVIGIDEEDSAEIEELYGFPAEEVFDNVVAFYEIEFPHNISKIYGDDVEGIEIDGNKLHIDMVKASMSVENTQVLVFETLKDGEKAEDKVLNFSDVSENQWFYHSVMTLANGGLVQGKGNGVFDPEGTITYAEFCQILARVQGMEYGEENGYWATKAVKSCVDMGYINDLGEVTPANYDIPITREAAVAAIARTYPYASFLGGESDAEWTINKESIPDYDMISAEYQQAVLAAYRLNITTGKDANMTFDPKATLTRAEVCQLFYNIDIVVAP